MLAEDIEKTLSKAQLDCGLNGQRMTEKRRKVLQVLLQAAAPLSAYEILDRFKSLFDEPLSAMSAYRMLDFLLENGLVHKLETTNQFLACSHIACEHEHKVPQFLICDHCHTVKEVDLPKSLLVELTASIDDTGFTLSNRQLELHGICQNCKQHGYDESSSAIRK